ncbi:MAG: putative colanic acid biosynthesis acetyltransferase [Kiritimatiellae bacterium]|nr:putative colanic acid biosynthesis acetyltransferase [Kiritimatiellia bacterium]
MVNLDLKNYKNRHSLMSKIARAVWNVVWMLLFRPTPRGKLFRLWRIALLKLFGAKVKWTSNVLPSCRIWQPWKLTMGEYACLGEDVDCYSVDEISVGDQALVSQGVKLCAAGHDTSSRIMELTYAPITVGANAWVAGWATVLPGVTIGEGAVVAAGAVVTKDVEPWTVVGGNPAKFIKKRVLQNEKVV